MADVGRITGCIRFADSEPRTNLLVIAVISLPVQQSDAEVNMPRKIALGMGIVISAVFLFFFIAETSDLSKLSLNACILLGLGPITFLLGTLLAFWRKAEAIAGAWMVICALIGNVQQLEIPQGRPGIAAIVIFYVPMMIAGVLHIYHYRKHAGEMNQVALEPTDSVLR
jgi:hypothetical protein